MKNLPALLAPEEEELHFSKMRSGDNEASDIIIEHNLRLVAHIAKKYCSHSTDNDDLISISTIEPVLNGYLMSFQQQIVFFWQQAAAILLAAQKTR